MDDDEAQNKKGDGSRYSPILVAILGAAIGSGGGIGVYHSTDLGARLSRPDPFTGSQADALIHRIERLEKAHGAHITAHPDQINQFDRRITTLEAQYPLIMQSLARIEGRLDTMK